MLDLKHLSKDNKTRDWYSSYFLKLFFAPSKKTGKYLVKDEETGLYHVEK